eukprot:CAMPEP_0174697888 /NCGR_PEP_ID=MMETSP1094-20130205/3631_1 /TAXON_ID=156173 /ORGANISM="Chrysochromulina brevifilum, Strain UTEX LB 985" /LENGTH=81 /DNA_ID=CAMNT_0015894967 /DNA_START=524 /DNA_END=769 /DNA_ORIENTATION=+
MTADHLDDGLRNCPAGGHMHPTHTPIAAIAHTATQSTSIALNLTLLRAVSNALLLLPLRLSSLANTGRGGSRGGAPRVSRR